MTDISSSSQNISGAESRPPGLNQTNFRTLVENSSDYIVRFDTQLRYAYVNPALCQAAGVPASAYLNKTMSESGMAEDQALFWEQALREVMETHEIRNFDLTRDTSAGPRYLQARMMPEFDEDGHVISVMSITRDMTESVNNLRFAEAELEKRANQQAAIANLGIMALNIDDVQVFMDQIVQTLAAHLNVEYCKVLELLPDNKSLLLRSGVGWHEGLVGNAIVGTELHSQAGYTLRSAEPVIVYDLRTETRFNGPALLREHDVVSGMSVIIHAIERPYGVLGAHTTQKRVFTENDIDFLQSISNLISSTLERVRMVSALRQSESRLTNILESAMDAIITINSDQEIILFNQAAEDMFGYQAEVAMGMSLERLVPAVLRDVHRQHIQHFAQSGATNRRMGALGALSGLRANGENFPIEASVSQIVSEGQLLFTVILRDITEQKKLEHDLRQSENQYRGLIESQVDLVCRYRPDTVMTYGNPAFYDYYGVSPGDVIGRPFVEYSDFESKAIILNRIEEILKDPRPASNVTQGRDATGKQNWVQWVDYGILDEKGQVVEIQAVGRDVSAQRHAEAVLRDERDFSDNLIDSLPGAFYLYDEQRRFLRWNAQFEHETGYSAEEIATMTSLQFIHPDDRDLADQSIIETFTVGNSALEGRFLHKDGSSKPFYFTGRRVRVGDQICLAGVGLDISQRKQAEMALIASEGRYRRLFDEAPIAIWQQDFSQMKLYLDELRASGISNMQAHLQKHPEAIRACLETVRIDDINKEALTLHGEASLEILSEKFAQIVDAGSMSQILSLVALSEGQTSFEGEFMNRTLNGDPLVMLLKWVVLPGYEDSYEKVLVASVNITERKQAEEEIRKLVAELEKRVEERTARLQEVNKELSEFAYVVSHDLKAPLRGVTQLANWLHQDYASTLDEQANGMLDLMVGRAKRMHDLIEGILQYSRIGRSKQKHTIIDVQLLVTDIIEILAAPPGIEVIIASELPKIPGEYTQIQQLFQNLIGNAIKHMDKPEGKITVKCRESEGMWLFSISDDGPGIEARYHEKIFRVFQTLKPSDVSESTGIGLALVKKIVELHKGEIWLESELGAGSTFNFTLPQTGEQAEDYAE